VTAREGTELTLTVEDSKQDLFRSNLAVGIEENLGGKLSCEFKEGKLVLSSKCPNIDHCDEQVISL